MSLAAASTLTRRARQSKAGSLGRTVAVHNRQIRGFRFGRLWSAYLDPGFRQDPCRHRTLRYKYTDSPNRRSSWDKHSLADDVKQVVNSYWHSGPKTNGERFPKTPDNPEGVRPGQNIEDVERAPLEHLLGGKKSRRVRKQERENAAHDTAVSTSEGNASSGDVVDPITNHKVFQKIVDNTYSAPDKGVDIPVSNPHPYKPQFTPFKAPEVKDAQEPIFHDGPPPEAELKKYGQVMIEASPWDSTSLPTLSGRTRSGVGHERGTGTGLINALGSEHKEVFWHHHDGIASSSGASTAVSWTSRPLAPEYSDLHKYTAVRYQEPDGKPSESIRENEDRSKYGAVRSHEPDGRYKVEQELAPKYDDTNKYGAVRSHEPDGHYKMEQESTQKYEDLDKYGPVRSYEPDGHYKMEQESTQKYEDLDKYGPVRSHEPDGHYKTEQESTQKYEDLDKYGPVRSHEPDGHYKTEQESTQKYEDLDKYGPVRSHEPDGHYKMEQESAQKYHDLDKYGAVRAFEPDGKYKLEPQTSVDPEELSKYSAFRSHEPDGKYASNHAKPEPDAAELAQYSNPFLSHEPDGKYAASYVVPKYDEADLGQYKAFRSHEPDGKYAAMHAEPKTVEDLGTYSAFRSHEPDGKYAAEHVTPTADPAESHQYQAFRSHEPDGKYAAEAESAMGAQDLGNHEAFSYGDSETKPPTPASQEQGYDPAELKKYQPLRWNEPDGKADDVQAVDQHLFEYDLNGESPDVKQQKTLEPANKPKAVVSSGPTEPSLYKVLVYDPTMQHVEAAETTSIIPDTSTPLSPAEVLLRISNPAKFFPHFGPLQAQGFEIVSGSGDVLIFRKVREASPTQPKPQKVAPPVNPIDMTGGPRRDYTVAAGRFASPTGFVNYDLPPAASSAAAAPRVSPSESDVHREEPAVGGGGREKAGEDRPASNKRVTAKRVAAGAAWLAGLSYSLGAVSEYFKG
ncbi:hypothetical protein BT67DRAFT_441777 [Trichocladium antarcticum]|uniref:Serine-threonine rich protein n=1 Tax=Trichocladium antarcticum TaxID=1450529 RepID=A0AAN6UKT9_9PEZI|nr:hypothetical protein BT67DRAFT_441777 [Trichocladium antarcticum]